MSGNSDFVIENGVLVKYNGPGGDVVIPEGVTEIWWGVFNTRSDLTSMVIPEGVTAIKNDAFERCAGLTSVTIPGSVTEIGGYAFENCTNLTSVVIPAGVTAIGEFAFCNCTALTSISLPDSIQRLGRKPSDHGTAREQNGYWLFSGCTALEQIHASDEIKKILFAKVDVDKVFVKIKERFQPAVMRDILTYTGKPTKNKKMLLRALIERDDASSLSILLERNYVANKRVRDELIDFAAEKGKTNCAAVLLDYKNRTADLAKEQEAEVKKLEKELTMPMEELLEKELKKNWLIAGEKSCEVRQYRGSETVVRVPSRWGGKSVRSVCEKVFSNYEATTPAKTKKLNQIVEIIIPNSITQLGKTLCRGCKGLEKVTLSANLTHMGSHAFKYCYKLSEINLQDTKLQEIERDTFNGCISLEKVTLPPTVKTLGMYAFAYCTGLKEIYIPETVTKISSVAFEGSKSLTIHAPAGSYAEEFAKKNDIRFIAE